MLCADSILQPGADGANSLAHRYTTAGGERLTSHCLFCTSVFMQLPHMYVTFADGFQSPALPRCTARAADDWNPSPPGEDF